MITVIDAIMGAGKTTYVLQMLKQKAHQRIQNRLLDREENSPRYLIVAPTLEEVDRYQNDCPDIAFRDPVPIKGRKLYGLKELIAEEADICTTHALFRLLDREAYELLRARNYVLIMDEVMTCVDLFDGLTKADRNILFRQGHLLVDEQTGRLRWNHQQHPNYRGKFEFIRNLCDNGNLVWSRGKYLIWDFPTEFLECFSQVFLLTYLFRGSPMCLHLKAAGVDFEIKTLDAERQLVPERQRDEGAIKARLRELIQLHPGQVKGSKQLWPERTDLSSGWYERASAKQDGSLQRLRRATEAFFRYTAGTGSALNGWTTLKAYRSELAANGYRRGWIPNNMKATNKFKDKASMAYLCNIFMNPVIKGYYTTRGVPVDEDLFALSEMLQWIWRSRIRDGQPVNLFIPSARMRGLFMQWLNSDSAANDNTASPATLAA